MVITLKILLPNDLGICHYKNASLDITFLTLLKLILLYYVDFIHSMFENSCVYVFNSNFKRKFLFSLQNLS
jgi:hypothetical protein